ncbi:putative lysophosphatidic acid:oleoyl-CoA acyltransferase [Cyphellophora attinorum]|uniref:Putative lysophosphatidic acid:oleoyl-CoA acyltransferase n=1 Tax=Cyphellophora attinorum TaxID=1664694 RepID=A0A0N1H0I3_9EURO|nr:putative lysophosphatidic acid:oleoyl-CoA acyltransferase [Phialophora attinorum]KPI37377.1 putative lysophosphatidic acid:oleoyl-CoA acyltransferase [Phialophora attinorum]
MEKFSQFRDKGSGIAPFLPIPTEPAGIYLPFHIFLYVCRVPLLLFFSIAYFAFLQFLPFGVIGRKGPLWCILGIPGIWWIDLAIDGVKKGSLAQHSARLPKPGSIIAASYNSPIDALYLAAIFDPIYAACYPNTRQVQPLTLFQATLRAFASPASQQKPSASATLVDLSTYVAQNPSRILVLFPESTTSNGRGVLPLSPALLSTTSKTKIHPVHMRYTPADITTPIPHSYGTFLWNLCSKPTHCIRIRIAEAVQNTASNAAVSAKASAIESLADSASEAETLVGSEDSEGVQTREERAFLDKIAEALARLGRVKRVGLGVKDKEDFIRMWSNKRH